MGFTVNLKPFNETKRNEKAKIKRQIITVNGEDEGDAMTMTKTATSIIRCGSQGNSLIRTLNLEFQCEYRRTNTNTIKAFQANHVPRTFALSCC